MKILILGIAVVFAYAMIAGWYGRADAQVLTITDDEGVTTEMFCYTIGDDIYCE